MDELISKANAGDAESQRVLGIMYANGQNVEKDMEKAKQYLRLAAMQKDAAAINVLTALGESIPAPAPAPQATPTPQAAPVQQAPKKEMKADPSYRPWNKFNLFLGAVGLVATFLFVYLAAAGGMSEEPLKTILFLLVGLGAIAFLFVRNMKMGDIGKAIGMTLLLTVLGAIIYIIAFFIWGSRFFWSAAGGGIKGGKSFGQIVDSLTFGKFRPSDAGTAYVNNDAPYNMGYDNGGNASQPEEYPFSKEDDLKAQMQGYYNAEQYQNATGQNPQDIIPGDEYTKAN